MSVGLCREETRSAVCRIAKSKRVSGKSAKMTMSVYQQLTPDGELHGEGGAGHH
jgi:hypothetical protein